MPRKLVRSSAPCGELVWGIDVHTTTEWGSSLMTLRNWSAVTEAAVWAPGEEEEEEVVEEEAVEGSDEEGGSFLSVAEVLLDLDGIIGAKESRRIRVTISKISQV